MSEPAVVFEDRMYPGEWRVEWYYDHVLCEVAIFAGRNARERASYTENCTANTVKSASAAKTHSRTTRRKAGLFSAPNRDHETSKINDLRLAGETGSEQMMQSEMRRSFKDLQEGGYRRALSRYCHLQGGKAESGRSRLRAPIAWLRREQTFGAGRI